MNPNRDADILRDPNVEIDLVLEILRQVPLWLDIFVMENPAFELLCLENPLWEQTLSVGTLYGMAGYLEVYRDPRCAQIVAKGILSHKRVHTYSTANRCLDHFMAQLLWVKQGISIGIEQVYELLQMIAEGKTPQDIKDFIGHQVK